MRNRYGEIIRYNANKIALRKALLNQAKQDKNIIYGAQSINAQVPNIFTRSTSDYDILTKNSKASANKTEKKFDKIVGDNLFYTKPAMHPGTHKVMFIGEDLKQGTKDDFGFVDYTNFPNPMPKYKTINGIRYRSLTEEARAKRKSLRDKQYAFRHAKDRRDLNNIMRYKRFGRFRK